MAITTARYFASATLALVLLISCSYAAPVDDADTLTASQNADLKKLVEEELLPALNSGNLEHIQAIAMRSARSFPWLGSSPFLQAATTLQIANTQTPAPAPTDGTVGGSTIGSISPILFALIVLALLLQYAKVLKAQG